MVPFRTVDRSSRRHNPRRLHYTQGLRFPAPKTIPGLSFGNLKPDIVDTCSLLVRYHARCQKKFPSIGPPHCRYLKRKLWCWWDAKAHTHSSRAMSCQIGRSSAWMVCFPWQKSQKSACFRRERVRRMLSVASRVEIYGYVEDAFSSELHVYCFHSYLPS